MAASVCEVRARIMVPLVSVGGRYGTRYDHDPFAAAAAAAAANGSWSYRVPYRPRRIPERTRAVSARLQGGNRVVTPLALLPCPDRNRAPPLMTNLALLPILDELIFQTPPAGAGGLGAQGSHGLIGALMGLLLGIVQLIIGLSIAAFAINQGFSIV